jgi:hypothetical protein
MTQLVLVIGPCGGVVDAGRLLLRPGYVQPAVVHACGHHDCACGQLFARVQRDEVSTIFVRQGHRTRRHGDLRAEPAGPDDRPVRELHARDAAGKPR